jgi:hypothetical protein
MIDDLKIESLPSDISTVGRSPNRQFYAVARKKCVTIHHGWDGRTIATLKWPTGKEGVPKGIKMEPFKETPIVTKLIPFDTGDKALLIGPQSIFVMTANRAIRLLPTNEDLQASAAWLNNPDHHLSMEHGAISPDGKLIAVGHQSSYHCVFDADSYQRVGEIGPYSQYPHHAVFSADGKLIAFNSCHFYGGKTIGVPTRLLPGLTTEAWTPDGRFTNLQDGERVYAAVFQNDEFIIGDAYGYVRAFDVNGNSRWQHFIGSTVEDIDVSRDGKRLVVTTRAGFLSIMDLDTGTPDPFAIGASTHRERRRWLFWKKEPRPLAW